MNPRHRCPVALPSLPRNWQESGFAALLVTTQCFLILLMCLTLRFSRPQSRTFLEVVTFLWPPPAQPGFTAPVQQQSDKLSTGGGLGAILLWSATFAFARSLSEQVGPLTSGTAAYLVGGLFCLLRLWWSKTPVSHFLRLPRRYLVGCGFLFVLYTTVLYLAVGLAKDRQQLLEVALVNYLWPALTILFSLPLLKQRANWWLLPGTALALSGVFLVMTQGARVSWSSFRAHLESNPVPFGLALIAAISWALYSNLARRWATPDSGGAVELFVPATGLVLLALRLLTTEPTGWSFRAVGEALGLAAVTTLAYILWDLAMRKGNLLLVVAGSYFTPLLSTLVSCVYLSVSPGPELWIGCLQLVAGSLMTWRAVSGRRPQS
jgi:drug/metabolite transporter (DMT)-like permease